MYVCMYVRTYVRTYLCSVLWILIRGGPYKVTFPPRWFTATPPRSSTDSTKHRPLRSMARGTWRELTEFISPVNCRWVRFTVRMDWMDPLCVCVRHILRRDCGVDWSLWYEASHCCDLTHVKRSTKESKKSPHMVIRCGHRTDLVHFVSMLLVTRKRWWIAISKYSFIAMGSTTCHFKYHISYWYPIGGQSTIFPLASPPLASKAPEFYTRIDWCHELVPSQDMQRGARGIQKAQAMTTCTGWSPAHARALAHVRPKEKQRTLQVTNIHSEVIIDKLDLSTRI